MINRQKVETLCAKCVWADGKYKKDGTQCAWVDKNELIDGAIVKVKKQGINNTRTYKTTDLFAYIRCPDFIREEKKTNG